MTSDGKPAVGARIECASAQYNPISNSEGKLISSTADNNGRCEIRFPEKGSITMNLYHPITGERMIARAISSNEGKQVELDTIHCQKPAALTLLIPDTITASEGFIPGTSIRFSTNSQISTVPGYHEISIDSLPAGTLPPLAIQKPSGSTTISDSVTTIADSVVSVVSQGENEESRALWRIRLIVGIQTTVTSGLGGESVADSLLNEQISRINQVFTDSRINGGLLFSIDSIYYFSGNVAAESANGGGFDLKLLISDEQTSSNSEWTYNQLKLIHYPTGTTTSSLFDLTGDWSLIRGLAISRGCFDRRSAEVDSDKNSVNSTQYRGSPSWLDGRGEGFSDFDITQINMTQEKKSYIDSDIVNFLPDTLGVKVVNGLGTPMPGKSVDIYLSDFGSRTLSAPFLSLLTTNSQGIVTIGYRTFTDSQLSAAVYGSILVAVNGTPVTYKWFSLDEVARSEIYGSGSRLDLTVVIP